MARHIAKRPRRIVARIAAGLLAAAALTPVLAQGAGFIADGKGCGQQFFSLELAKVDAGTNALLTGAVFAVDGEAFTHRDGAPLDYRHTPEGIALTEAWDGLAAAEAAFMTGTHPAVVALNTAFPDGEPEAGTPESDEYWALYAETQSSDALGADPGYVAAAATLDAANATQETAGREAEAAFLAELTPATEAHSGDVIILGHHCGGESQFEAVTLTETTAPTGYVAGAPVSVSVVSPAPSSLTLELTSGDATLELIDSQRDLYRLTIPNSPLPTVAPEAIPVVLG